MNVEKNHCFGPQRYSEMSFAHLELTYWYGAEDRKRKKQSSSRKELVKVAARAKISKDCLIVSFIRICIGQSLEQMPSRMVKTGPDSVHRISRIPAIADIAATCKAADAILRLHGCEERWSCAQTEKYISRNVPSRTCSPPKSCNEHHIETARDNIV